MFHRMTETSDKSDKKIKRSYAFFDIRHNIILLKLALFNLIVALSVNDVKNYSKFTKMLCTVIAYQPLL